MIFVPETISPEVESLISKIGITQKPHYVPCRPNADSPQNECFSIVDARVESEGGKKILGWQIWQGQLLVEAEFHAVWKSPNGEVIDITPKSRSFDNILFIPDRNTIYEGKQVNNIRVNISGNPLVDDFIAVYGAVFRIENKGERALQYELSLCGNELDAHEQLSWAKLHLEVMAHEGKTRKSLCPCESGYAYKICHGKKIRKLIKKL